MQVPLALQTIWETLLSPISPKNLRLSAILIAIYQLLIAHVVFFLMLLGLAHAEQVKTMLTVDMADQVECEYYELTPNAMNEVRLKAASELVSATEVILCIGTGLSFVYLISCLSLFCGVFKSKPEPILPWLILDFIGILFILVTMWTENEKMVSFFGGKQQYWIFCIGFTTFDLMVWYVIHAFYSSLRQITKLTEVATVAIPCHPPGEIPFYFRKENMYLGNGSLKHSLSDSDPNEKV